MSSYYNDGRGRSPQRKSSNTGRSAGSQNRTNRRRKKKKSPIGLMLLMVLLIILMVAGCNFIKTRSDGMDQDKQDQLMQQEQELQDALLNSDTIHEGITVNGVSLAGMTKEEAVEAVNSAMGMEPHTMTLSYGDYTAQVPLLVGSNLQQVIDEAYNIGRSGSREENLEAIEEAADKGVEFTVEAGYSLPEMTEILNNAALALDREAQNANVTGFDQETESFTFADGVTGVNNRRVDDLNRLFLKSKRVEHRVKQMLKAEHAAECKPEKCAYYSARNKYFAKRHFHDTEKYGICYGHKGGRVGLVIVWQAVHFNVHLKGTENLFIFKVGRRNHVVNRTGVVYAYLNRLNFFQFCGDLVGLILRRPTHKEKVIVVTGKIAAKLGYLVFAAKIGVKLHYMVVFVAEIFRNSLIEVGDILFNFGVFLFKLGYRVLWKSRNPRNVHTLKEKRGKNSVNLLGVVGGTGVYTPKLIALL